MRKALLEDIREALERPKTSNEKEEIKYSEAIWLKPYIKASISKLLIASILSAILSIIAIPLPYLMKIIVDGVYIRKEIKYLWIVISILVGIQIIRIGSSIMMNYLFTVSSQEISLKIRNDLFKKILRMPLSFFDKYQSGYLLSRIGEVSGISIIFSGPIVQTAISLAEFSICMTILIIYYWPAAIMACFIIPFYIAVVKRFSRGIKKYSNEIMEKSAILSKKTQETISGINEVKIFSKENGEADNINSNLKSLFRSNRIQSLFISSSSELIILIGTLGGYGILVLCALQIVKNEMTIGDYIAISGYFVRLFSSSQAIAYFGVTIQPAKIALKRVSSIFHMIGEDDCQNGKIEVSKIRGEIEFKSVYFGYESREDVLKNVSFKIEQGENVAIVGKSGVGKTTIIRLMLGLYLAEKGNIYIDDNVITKYKITQLRERFGIVSQNIFMFNDTIENNIKYGKQNASRMEVEEAAKMAEIADTIKAFKNDYSTIIGEKGVMLSGGQIQRLAIARAIIKNPDILILDEATSNVDNETEGFIRSRMHEIFINKTRIIIAHKSGNEISSRKILNIENGIVDTIIKYDSNNWRIQ